MLDEIMMKDLLNEVRQIRDLLEKLVVADPQKPKKAKPKKIDILVGNFDYKAQDDSIWSYKYCLKGLKIPFKFKDDFKGKAAELSPDHEEGDKYRLGYMWEAKSKSWTIFSDEEKLIKQIAEHVVTELEGEI